MTEDEWNARRRGSGAAGHANFGGGNAGAGAEDEGAGGADSFGERYRDRYARGGRLPQAEGAGGLSHMGRFLEAMVGGFALLDVGEPTGRRPEEGSAGGLEGYGRGKGSSDKVDALWRRVWMRGSQREPFPADKFEGRTDDV